VTAKRVRRYRPPDLSLALLTEPNGTQWIGTAGLMGWLEISKSTVYRWRARQGMPFARYGQFHFYPIEGVRQWLIEDRGVDATEVGYPWKR